MESANYSPFKSKSDLETDIKYLEKIIKERRNKTNSQIKQIRHSNSAFGKDRNHCLCKVLKPVIYLWQAFGIMPVSHDQNNCKMIHKWVSVQVFITIGWVIANIIAMSIGAPAFIRLFAKDINGIDRYTFTIVMGVQFTSTMCIFASATFVAPQFVKAWSELHSATEAIAMPNFQRVKYLIYLLPFYLLQEMFINSGIYSWVVLSGNIKFDDIPITAQLGAFSANLIPNLTSGIYGVFLSIVAINFKAINKNLQTILQKENTEINIGKYWNSLLPLQISQHRILHEKLCTTIRFLDGAFGIQILAVFAGTCVSFVCGIYGLIIGCQNLAQTPRMNSLLVGFGLSTMIAGVRVLIVNWFCQDVMNSGNGTAHILNNYKPETGLKEVNVQVEKFLQKLGNFPIQTKCCNVFQLGNSFFAAAASVVVTYVLILIQFRIAIG